MRERVSSAAFGANAEQAYMALMEIVCSLDDYLRDMQVRLEPRTPVYGRQALQTLAEPRQHPRTF